MYRSDGLVTPRCGSFATMTCPLAVSRPLIAQLLLPGESSRAPRLSETRASSQPSYGATSGGRTIVPSKPRSPDTTSSETIE